jgi:Fe-S cluster assembly protein SufD
VVIIADADSRAAIGKETYAGINNDVYFTNDIAELRSYGQPTARRIDHYKVQKNEPVTAFHLALLDVQQARNSRFSLACD